VNICAIARNEGLYIREWVLFHQIVGVQHISVYNNRSDDNTLEVLQPFVESGFVDVIDWPMPNPSQFAAYQHCVNRFKGQPMWVAFIDVDEFLFSPQFWNIQEAMDSFPYKWGAIGVNWMCFGSSGKEEWSPEPVIERFTWRDFSSNPVNQHIKSVVWMAQDGIQVGGTPHHFHTTMGTFDERGRRVAGPFTESHSSDILRINHYSSKSRQEWLTRSKLGKPDRASMDIDPEWYEARQAMEVEDLEIWKYLPQLKEAL
jgi:glycosyltransferase involved in cell wall biosynthesis